MQMKIAHGIKVGVMIVSGCMALSGCGAIQSSDALHEQRHSVTHPSSVSSIKSKFISQMANFKLHSVFPEMVATMHRNILQVANMTATGKIVVNHTTYQINLPAHTKLMYTLSGNGVLWTIYPDTTFNIPIQLIGSLYLTPYVSSSFAQRAIPKSNVALENNSTLLFRDNTSYSTAHIKANAITLYKDPSATLFSYPMMVNGQRVSQFAALIENNKTVQLLGQYPADQPPEIAPTTNGVFYARMNTLTKNSNMVWIYHNFITDSSTVIHTNFTPQAFYSDASNAAIIAGPDLYHIDAKAKIQVEHTPPLANSSAFTAMLDRLQLPSLYVPSLAFHSASSPSVLVKLSITSPTSYHVMWHETQSQAPLTVSVSNVTFSATHAYQIPIQHKGAKDFVLPSKNLSTQPIMTIPDYFGKYKVQSTMILSSSQGPYVEWLNATPLNKTSGVKKGSAPSTWFAAFAVGSWTYILGPFSSPANPTQTKRLSALITAATQSPLPSLPSRGLITLKMTQNNNTSTTLQSSRLDFNPKRGLFVRISGPGLIPIKQLSLWTVTNVSTTT